MIKSSDILSFGGRLRYALKKEGVTQAALAEFLTDNGYPCDAKTVAFWCRLGTQLENKTGRRRPHPYEYLLIADRLKINAGWLLFHGADAAAPMEPDAESSVIRITSREDYEAWTRWQRLSAEEKRAWMVITSKMHKP